MIVMLTSDRMETMTFWVLSSPALGVPLMTWMIQSWALSKMSPNAEAVCSSSLSQQLIIMIFHISDQVVKVQKFLKFKLRKSWIFLSNLKEFCTMLFSRVFLTLSTNLSNRSIQEILKILKILIFCYWLSKSIIY